MWQIKIPPDAAPAKAKNPDAVVVAAGCYVQAAADKLREDAAVDLIIGNNRKGGPRSAFRCMVRGKAIKESITDLAGSNEYEKLHIKKTGRTYPRLH